MKELILADDYPRIIEAKNKKLCVTMLSPIFTATIRR